MGVSELAAVAVSPELLPDADILPTGRTVTGTHVRSRASTNAASAHHGANIDRETRANIETAGFQIECERDLWLDIVKLFQAKSR